MTNICEDCGKEYIIDVEGSDLACDECNEVFMQEMQDDAEAAEAVEEARQDETFYCFYKYIDHETNTRNIAQEGDTQW